jgi:hypothetical protein
LFVLGAIAFVSGAVMVGFGIPVNEFSFGNTLITSGVTTIVGGLILGGLGAMVAQLQRVAEALSVRPPRPASRPVEALDTQPIGNRTVQSAPWDGRVPFPPKTKPEPKSEPKSDVFPRDFHAAEPRVAAPEDASHDERPGLNFAPMLRNPDEPPFAVGDFDEASLSPREYTPMPRTASEMTDHGRPSAPPPFAANGSGAGSAEKHQEPAVDTGWRMPPPSTRPPNAAQFDAMWPAELRGPRSSKAEEAKPAPSSEPARERAAPVAERHDTETLAPRPAADTRSVAILKSGMVDGMGYTLYVDGSIEAELPQGTLRFASITELRTHLEKNS